MRYVLKFFDRTVQAFISSKEMVIDLRLGLVCSLHMFDLKLSLETYVPTSHPLEYVLASNRF